MKALKNLFKNEDGATAIEYALIAALMAVVLIAIFTALGTSLTTGFSGIGAQVAAPR